MVGFRSIALAARSERSRGERQVEGEDLRQPALMRLAAEAVRLRKEALIIPRRVIRSRYLLF